MYFIEILQSFFFVWHVFIIIYLLNNINDFFINKISLLEKKIQQNLNTSVVLFVTKEVIKNGRKSISFICYI